MKKNLTYPGVILLLLFGSCGGIPKESFIEWSPPPPPAQDVPMYRVTDHKTAALGEDIPDWVIRYDSGVFQQAAYLLENSGSYIFISANRGTNFKLLQQWNAGFRLILDFPRLVALRMQERFTKGSATFPDQDYGGFFEAAIKDAYDALFTGPVQEADFWIKKQYVKADGVTVDKEEYVFFILISIAKEALQLQITTILGNAKPDRPLTKEQAAAAESIKKTFFEDF
jgi:hypothetical protein